MDTTTSTSTASAASITAATTEATITARPAPGPTSSSSSNPPQRQSCDRCHKQKLRCIRNKNQNGGVCDRCLSKRAQCVYSYSLPKGRPSLHRLADESNGNAARAKSRAQSAATSTTGTASEPLRAPDTINAGKLWFIPPRLQMFPAVKLTLSQCSTDGKRRRGCESDRSADTTNTDTAM